MNIPRNNSATLWRVSNNSDDGSDTFSLPVPIMVRWEDVTSIEYDRSGSQFVSKARIFIDPNLALSLGDYLYKGTTEEANPHELAAWPIKSIKSIPPLSAGDAVVTAFL